MRQQALHGGQVLARKLHDLQVVPLGPDLRMDRFHQARFPHPARAPEKGVVRRQPGGEMAGVLQKRIARAVHADQKREVDAGNPRHRLQPVGGGVPDEGFGRSEIGGRHRRGRQPLQRGGDAVQRVGHALPAPAPAPASGSSSSSMSTQVPSARIRASRSRSNRAIRKIDIS